jgi:dynactin complex subunit
MFSICLINGISNEIQWIPREGNTQADYLSKIIDYEDWGVSDFLVVHILRKFFLSISSVHAAAATLLASEYMIMEDLSQVLNLLQLMALISQEKV